MITLEVVQDGRLLHRYQHGTTGPTCRCGAWPDRAIGYVTSAGVLAFRRKAREVELCPEPGCFEDGSQALDQVLGEQR